MRRRTSICNALLVLQLAGTVLVGTTIHAGLQAVTNPTTAFTYRTRLPGGRALWLSKRRACRPTLAPLGCRYHGLNADPRLSISYTPARSRPVKLTIRLPQRQGHATLGNAGPR